MTMSPTEPVEPPHAQAAPAMIRAIPVERETAWVGGDRLETRHSAGRCARSSPPETPPAPGWHRRENEETNT